MFAVIRFMKLVDSVLPLLVPRWEYSQASFTSLEVSLWLGCRELCRNEVKRWSHLRHGTI